MVRRIEQLDDDHDLTKAVIKRISYPNTEANDKEFVKLQMLYEDVLAEDMRQKLVAAIDINCEPEVIDTKENSVLIIKGIIG